MNEGCVKETGIGTEIAMLEKIAGELCVRLELGGVPGCDRVEPVTVTDELASDRGRLQALTDQIRNAVGIVNRWRELIQN